MRAEVVTGERRLLVEAEIRAAGRNRVLCNKQPIGRARDQHEVLRVSVFAPDDLGLVKDGPSSRRAYLDELLVMLAARYDAARSDFERVLKQRNALLRAGCATRAREHARRLRRPTRPRRDRARAGRLQLVARLGPAVDAAYRELAPASGPVTASYTAEWAPVAIGDRRHRRRRRMVAGRIDRAAVRRARPRADACRPASRRVAARDRRARRAHAGVAGRATQPGAGAAPGRAHGRPRAHGCRTGAACSTMCSASSITTARRRSFATCRRARRCSRLRARFLRGSCPSNDCAWNAGW